MDAAKLQGQLLKMTGCLRTKIVLLRQTDAATRHANQAVSWKPDNFNI
jgi:hypothetical protein